MSRAAAQEKYGISLAELVAIFRTVRHARMTRNPELRAIAKAAALRGARELERLASLLDRDVVIGRRFSSAIESWCRLCGQPIRVGDFVAWLPRTPICERCAAPKERAA